VTAPYPDGVTLLLLSSLSFWTFPPNSRGRVLIGLSPVVLFPVDAAWSFMLRFPTAVFLKDQLRAPPFGLIFPYFFRLVAFNGYAGNLLLSRPCFASGVSHTSFFLSRSLSSLETLFRIDLMCFRWVDFGSPSPLLKPLRTPVRVGILHLLILG